MGRNVSLIAAMNIHIHGMVHTKIVANSSVNSTIFCTFISELFAKLSQANVNDAWLVLDNARIHKTQEVRDAVRQTTNTMVFLSPFSPMLNRIEQVFSKIKFSARDTLVNPVENQNLANIIKECVEIVTPQDCNNYYLDMSMKLPLAGQEL